MRSEEGFSFSDNRQWFKGGWKREDQRQAFSSEGRWMDFSCSCLITKPISRALSHSLANPHTVLHLEIFASSFPLYLFPDLCNAYFSFLVFPSFASISLSNSFFIIHGQMAEGYGAGKQVAASGVMFYCA